MMKIAIDISPLKNGHYLQHRVRGTGFYIESLIKSLQELYPENEYIFFKRGDKLQNDIDIIHYPYFEPFFLTLPFLKNNKTVVTVHDLTPFVFPEQFPSGIRGNLKWQIQKNALKKADEIITDSISSKKDIMKYAEIKENKISVVYLAPSNEFKRLNNISLLNKIRGKYNLPEKFVLYVGDATWNKNLPRLIKAIKKTGFPFIMVGKAVEQDDFDKNNPWNKDLTEVKELVENDKNINLLGFVPTEDLAAIYNLATVFAMPSLYEGFGLPVLEAMSCGCPVVTSEEGSISEIALDMVYYVNAYNLESIVEGLVKIFNSTKLQQDFATKGLQRARDFSWKKTAEDTMSIYSRIIAYEKKD